MDGSIHINAEDNSVLLAAQVALMKKQNNQDGMQVLSLLESTVESAEAIQNASQVSMQTPRELPPTATFEIEV